MIRAIPFCVGRPFFQGVSAATRPPPTDIPLPIEITMVRLPVLLMTIIYAMPVAAADKYEANFGKKLDEKWSFIREDKADWRLKDGNLQLLAQPSNIWGKKNEGTENFLLRPLPGKAFTVEVTVDFTPENNYEQAGIMIYGDDDNYIKFDRELVKKKQSCTLVLESEAKPRAVKMTPFRDGPLQLRLVIDNGKVIAQVKSPKDKTWTDHGHTTLPGRVDKLGVGLFALNGDKDEPRWATFRKFSLTTGGKDK